MGACFRLLSGTSFDYEVDKDKYFLSSFHINRLPPGKA